MLLKNLMEDKQLNFNQPLLSTRRYPSPMPGAESEGKRKTNNSLPKVPRPPIYKSELKSGPIRNPGTVPFVWEKTPGRPKEETSSQTQALQLPPVAPKLPPGRVLNDKQHSSSNVFEGSKTLTPSQNQTVTVLSSPQHVLPSKGNEAICKSSRGDMDETGSCGSKDSDEAYVDALDTLSRTESFFFNCSISGVSGFDGPEIRPSGVFSTDPQTRDFMMGRFLPAAKAVASETPPYATRKQTVVRAPEPERQIKKVVTVDKQQLRYGSSPNKFANHVPVDWSEESEDEDDYSQSQDSSANVCGLLPQFLLKGSLCLLNPVPGMKIQTQKPVRPASPAYSVRRRQAKSSYVGSGNETENEHVEAASLKGLTGISQTEEPIEDKNNLKSGSSNISYRSDCQKPNGPSLIRHWQSNDASSYHSQISKSVHQERGFLGIPEKAKNYGVSSIDPIKKGSTNFQELLAMESIDHISGSDNPVEKTLYVDSVHKVISSNSHFSDTRALAQCMEDDSGVLVKPGELEETFSVDSSLQEFKELNNVVDEKATVQHKNVEPVESKSLFSSEKHVPDMQLDVTDGFRRDKDLIQDSRKDDVGSQARIKLSSRETSHGLVQDSITLSNSKVSQHRKIGLESHLQRKSRNQESSHGNGSYFQLPLAPPLPKAPSESWLKRALPTVSSKNSSSRSCLGTHTSPALSGDPKWETIVRSSNVHHGHLRFSEEQLPTIPEA